MIVEFNDAVTGTPVHINPGYVVSVRPDPETPLEVSVVKLKDGETIRVRGEHSDVADRLSHATV